MFSRTTSLLMSKNQSRHSFLTFACIALALAPPFIHAQEKSLRLDEALQLSLQRSALTKAAAASVQASLEVAAKSRQFPDPMLKVGIENLPVDGPDRFSTTRDFMTMRRIGVEQQWVSAEKRDARFERAARVVEMEEGQYLARVAKIREETAAAWVNVLYGQRALALLKAIEQVASDDLSASRAAHRGAKATASDVTQAQLALSLARDASRKAEQELKNFRTALNRWTVVPVESVADVIPPLTSHVANLPVEDLEKYHPTVFNARREIALAEADTTLATRERRPDWTVEAGFSQRGSQYSNMVSVGISIPLAVNPSQKQDRDIAEKSSLVTRAKLQYDDALRETQSEIQNLSSTLTSTNERVSLLKAELLSAATQQVDLSRAAYRAGVGSLSALVGAQKSELERKLQVLALEREAAQTWAKLEHHLVPHQFVSSARAAQ